MSDQRNRGRDWGTIFAVGAGLGLAAATAAVTYALTKDKKSPQSELPFSRKCNKCFEVIHSDDSDTIQLLCNHVFHEHCLRMAYQQHTSRNFSGKPFMCPSCYVIVPHSVITELTGQSELPGPSSSSMSLSYSSPLITSLSCSSPLITNECRICESPLNGDAIIRLLCGHDFHKSCVLANYRQQPILNLSGGGSSCPISSCKRMISQSVIDHLQGASAQWSLYS